MHNSAHTHLYITIRRNIGDCSVCFSDLDANQVVVWVSRDDHHRNAFTIRNGGGDRGVRFISTASREMEYCAVRTDVCLGLLLPNANTNNTNKYVLLINMLTPKNRQLILLFSVRRGMYPSTKINMAYSIKTSQKWMQS
jgi:hypothetical protein